MAFTLDDERNKDPQAEQPLMMPAGVSGGAGAAAVGPGGSTGGGAPGHFTTMDQYFNANKDSANEMAKSVGDQVQGQVDAVGKETGGVLNKFQSQVNQGITNPAVDMVKTNGRLTPSDELGVSNLQRPTTQFNYTPGTYAGPTGLAPGALDKASGLATTAASSVGNLGSSAGLENFNANNFKSNPNYTAGMSRFDAGLLGTAGGGRFAQLRKATPMKTVTDATGAADKMVAAGKEHQRLKNADAEIEADQSNQNLPPQLPPTTVGVPRAGPRGPRDDSRQGRFGGLDAYYGYGN